MFDADLVNNELALSVYSNACEDLKKNSYLKGTTNIYSNNYKQAEKIKKLLKVGLIHMLRASYITIEDVHLKAF